MDGSTDCYANCCEECTKEHLQMLCCWYTTWSDLETSGVNGGLWWWCESECSVEPKENTAWKIFQDVSNKHPCTHVFLYVKFLKVKILLKAMTILRDTAKLSSKDVVPIYYTSASEYKSIHVPISAGCHQSVLLVFANIW